MITVDDDDNDDIYDAEDDDDDDDDDDDHDDDNDDDNDDDDDNDNDDDYHVYDNEVPLYPLLIGETKSKQTTKKLRHIKYIIGFLILDEKGKPESPD